MRVAGVEAATLREEARRCERLSRGSSDPTLCRQLLDWAEEYWRLSEALDVALTDMIASPRPEPFMAVDRDRASFTTPPLLRQEPLRCLDPDQPAELTELIALLEPAHAHGDDRERIASHA